MWWIIPLFFLILSVVVVIGIVIRKIPQLRIINTDILPKEKSKRVKQAIIMRRFERHFGKRYKKGRKVFQMMGNHVSKRGRKFAQKLYALEQSYRKKQEGHLEQGSQKDEQTIRRLLQEADTCIKQEEYFQAEKRYIEIISRHPKYAKAYEKLGNLYLREKKYEQAKESLLFSLRLQKDDASVLMSLGEIALLQKQYQEAAYYLKQTIELRPNNPKYLDAFIEAMIQSGRKFEAIRGLAFLRKVNPENQKLERFEERIGEID